MGDYIRRWFKRNSRLINASIIIKMVVQNLKIYILVNNFFIANININETAITTIDLNIWTSIHVTYIILTVWLLLNHRYTGHCTSVSCHDYGHDYYMYMYQDYTDILGH